jgi:hypothetical protein
MADQPEHLEEQMVSRAEALSYVTSWKGELDLRQKELYSRLFSGAMGGVATIVLSSGIAFDKLDQVGWLVKVTLGLALLLLLLGAGNIMNCFVLAVNGQIELLRMERKFTLGHESVPLSELLTVEQRMNMELSRVQINYAYSYYCILFAVIAGAFTFLITLARSQS